MKNQKILNAVLILMTIAVIAFIWVNSTLSSNKSNSISDELTETVGGEITNTKAEEAASTTWMTSRHIRKLAHVTEFATLGALTVLFILRKKKLNWRSFPGIALFGLLTGLIDETIQLFNDRTSSVKDVWIDFGGFLFGCMIIWLLFRRFSSDKASNGKS